LKEENEIEIECKEMKSKEKYRLREIKLEARKVLLYLRTLCRYKGEREEGCFSSLG